MPAVASISLSVVLVVYNMRREAARTLRSLAATYQHGVAPDEYEVLVVENGSPQPLDPAAVALHGPQFRYLPAPEPHPSPARAINYGLAQSRGRFVAVMIDGARLASPGLLPYGLRAARTAERAVVVAPNYHLGSDVQRNAALSGYNSEVEDGLLAGIGWPDGDAYRLFEIAAFGGSYKYGLLQTPVESNFVLLPRESFAALGGYAEDFDLPGGGYLSADALGRACQLPGARLILLAGEGTFHQCHGGETSNASLEEHRRRLTTFGQQYERLRGRPLEAPRLPLEHFGYLPPAAWRFLAASTTRAMERRAATHPDDLQHLGDESRRVAQLAGERDRLRAEVNKLRARLAKAGA